MKLVTHNDRFHADDVFATAALRLLLGEKITEIVRTRDEEVFKTADIIYDVGGEYNQAENKFDHHQAGYDEARENKIPYSSFGLIWKKWGAEICGSQEAADIIDEKLVQVIDAHDNGFPTHEKIDESYSSYSVDGMIASFGPTWQEDDDFDTRFFDAVDFVSQILNREILGAQHALLAVPLLQKAYERAEDKRIIELDQYIPFGKFFRDREEVLYVVSPNKEKTQWRVVVLQEAKFVNRKDLPETWAGLRMEELQKVTGVDDATFCHRGLFLAVAKSKDGALQLAKLALKD